MVRGAFPPVAPSAPNMVARLSRSSAAPEKAALTSSSRIFAVRLVGDGEGGELLAMGGKFLGEIGEAEDERAGGGRVDAAGGDGAGLVADGRRRAGSKRPFLKLPRRCCGCGALSGGRRCS